MTCWADRLLLRRDAARGLRFRGLSVVPNVLFLRSISHDKLENKSCRPPRMCTRLMHTIGRIFDNNERNISCATFWRKRGRMKCLVEGLNSKLTEQERQLNDKQRQMKGRSDIKESSLKQSPV